MNDEEAFKIIQRQTPCGHEDMDLERVGMGDLKCSACNVYISRERLPKSRKAAKDFDNAVVYLRDQIKAKKDAKPSPAKVVANSLQSQLNRLSSRVDGLEEQVHNL